MSTDIVPASAPLTVVEPEATDVTVVARNPQEMMVAQHRLVTWADRKVSEAKAEQADLEENAAIARRSKWNHAALDRAATRARKRVEFYEKIYAALAAGYVIIPNMPMDVFAIRTTRRTPAEHYIEDNWRGPRAQESNSPALGEGDYVSSDAKVMQKEIPSPTERDPKNTVTARWAEDFAEVDFPFAAAMPAVLSATAEAMAKRIFDDLGSSPAKRVTGPKGDPMVIGRVTLKNGPATRSVSFLVTWFISTADL